MKNKFIQILLLLGAVVFVGCPDDVVVNPKPVDPCAEYSADPPKILVYEKVGDTSYILKDRFYGGSSSIKFRASRKCDTYEWTVGTDPKVRTDSSFTIHFDDYIGQVIVRLITFSSRDTLCNPADNGRDTVYASYTVIDPWRIDVAPPFHGTYRGVSTENLLDTFTINIGFLGIGNLPEATILNNLPKGCVDPYQLKPPDAMYSVGYGMRGIYVVKDDGTWGGKCRNMYGKGFLDEDGNTFIFHYNAYVTEYNPRLGLNNKERITATFRGVRQ
jgi:hypothetical protein